MQQSEIVPEEGSIADSGGAVGLHVISIPAQEQHIVIAKAVRVRTSEESHLWVYNFNCLLLSVHWERLYVHPAWANAQPREQRC